LTHIALWCEGEVVSVEEWCMGGEVGKTLLLRIFDHRALIS
jgi:hypothetical protein